jgi:hypothetical protein
MAQVDPSQSKEDYGQVLGKLPSREEAVAMMKSGLAKTLQEVTALYVMPLCWIHAEHGKPVIADNGSGFLLDCGKGPFLVTCNHVYEGFIAARAQRPDTICLVGLSKFPLSDRLIAADKSCDIATFRLTADELATLRATGKYQSNPFGECGRRHCLSQIAVLSSVGFQVTEENFIHT